MSISIFIIIFNLYSTYLDKFVEFKNLEIENSGISNPASNISIKNNSISFESNIFSFRSNPESIKGLINPEISISKLSYITPSINEMNTYIFSYLTFNTSIYKEELFLISISRKMPEIKVFAPEEVLSFGANIKLLKIKYTPDSYTENFFLEYGNEKEALSFDFGIFYKKRFKYSITMKNIASGDIGIIENFRLKKITTISTEFNFKKFLLSGLLEIEEDG
ncbi:MAG: hypothetical protein DRI36_05275, partial [Caldiserica bacterium]